MCVCFQILLKFWSRFDSIYFDDKSFMEEYLFTQTCTARCVFIINHRDSGHGSNVICFLDHAQGTGAESVVSIQKAHIPCKQHSNRMTAIKS